MNLLKMQKLQQVYVAQIYVHTLDIRLIEIRMEIIHQDLVLVGTNGNTRKIIIKKDYAWIFRYKERSFYKGYQL